MRLGLLIYGSLDNVSGGYLYDRQLVRCLEANGDKVEVISIPMHHYSRNLIDNFSGDLFRKLASLKVDVLLQDELNHPSLVYMNRRINSSIHYPVFAIVHHLRSSEYHPNWQQVIYSSIEKMYLKSVDGFIFNSKNTSQAVQDLIGSMDKTVVAYPAGDRLHPRLNQDYFATRAHQSSSLKILFVGNLIPRKGLHVLLASLHKIKDLNWHLSVAGSFESDRSYARRIMQLLRDYNFEQRVILYGPQDDKELSMIMQENHVMAVPSYHEGFGIAYLEGMGFGLPAIATTSGGASEIITHGVDGYLVPREDESLLADCIANLIGDKELLIEMSLAARARYLRHPTWDDSMHRIRNFLIENIQGANVR